jgi:NADP-dependent aldehyde dehydrogenase
MTVYPVLIDGVWREAERVATFRAVNPSTGEPLPGEYPVSSWNDCDAALDAAARAAATLRQTAPSDIAKFLVRFAERIEARAKDIVETAHLESGLPRSPRLADVELPRTTNQLRQAAAAAEEGSWALATIDTKQNIRSMFAPLGPIAVFGPNNFPFAFSGAAGGDFAAAVAAGNPVIAKGHPNHPGTARLFVEEAVGAAGDTKLPPATIQLLYRIEPQSGARLVSDARIGGSAFTGSRRGGLTLKAAADVAGKPIYLEMSSVNPVVIMPGALGERGAAIAQEFVASSLLGAGQFCTNPGLVMLIAGPDTDAFIESVKQAFEHSTPATLLSTGVLRSLKESLRILRDAGAELVTTERQSPSACSHPSTLLRATASQFLASSETLQTEAFGPAALFVVAATAGEAAAAIDHLDGSLTGCIYSAAAGADDQLYAELAPRLRLRVGRLLNDKMPTGVTVSPAMNHGGPFPATGHPGFTAVGIPAALRRFGALHCYDNVREQRLPPMLRNKNPNGRAWRSIDGRWTQADA